MTSRRKIQLISVTIATILVLGGTTLSGYLLAGKYRSNLEFGYQRALNDLGDYVANIESTLVKATYASTAPQQNSIAAKLMREASGAKASLAILPTKNNELSNINKFIAQVGDFSMALSKKVSEGGTIAPEEYEQLKGLESYAQKLHMNISDIQSKFSSGNIQIGEAEKLLNNLEQETMPVFGDNFEEASQDFADYPTLIYDGPFSDHIGQMKPKLLDGESELPQGNAQTIAAQFLGVNQSQLKHAIDTEGNLPTYNFMYDQSRISVTKVGGHVTSMINPREIGEKKLGYAESLKIAQQFFEQCDIKSMKESYYVINDGKCVLNFAYSEGDTIFYSDLIKVAVALDNGEIVEYNSSGYLMNHHNRERLTAKLTMAEAQKKVSSFLTVEKGRPALIPTSGMNEVYCYEFQCKAENGDQVLVYIDANTGYEKQILILISSENGVLTK